MVLASSFALLVGTASAHGTVKPQEATAGACTVRSLPSFIAQGEFSTSATVGDVIEVSCNPLIYSDGAEVTITAAQLYDRCGHEVTWYDPNEDGEYSSSDGNSVNLHLDVDGNANVGLIAGPHCMVGDSLITLDEDESPYETFTTSFTVMPDVNTEPGVFMEPAAQVEDAESSAVVTIAQAEFKEASESYVRIGARQLFDRCQEGDHLIVVSESREETTDEPEVLEAIRLDDNGNGFALLLGSDSCAEGTSLIEADLESSPFETFKADFKVESPRPERLTEV
jgi:hypothetical protein